MRAHNAEKCGGVLHCFTEDWEMAKKAIDMGFYISISGIVTFKNAVELKDVVKKIPLDRLINRNRFALFSACSIPWKNKPTSVC